MLANRREFLTAAVGVMANGKYSVGATSKGSHISVLNYNADPLGVTLRSVSQLASRINTGRVVHAVFGQRWLGQSEVGIGYTRV
jgi:hypothetical protein